MRTDTMAARGQATYEDLLRVPDTKVAELVAGELHVSPRPATPHAFAASELTAVLHSSHHGVEAPLGPGGWWILAEPELHFDADVVVPDLAGWRHDRMPAVPNVAAITLAPDWLCEITSPSSARWDRIVKLRVYARVGVAWVWLVDPLARTLECFHLRDGAWTVHASHADDEVARVAPFAATELRLSRWWLPAGPR